MISLYDKTPADPIDAVRPAFYTPLRLFYLKWWLIIFNGIPMAVNGRLSRVIKTPQSGTAEKLLYAAMVLLVLVPCHAYSQRLVSGKVTDSLHGVPLYPATVINATSGRAVYTDSSGRYRIMAKNDDELQYRYLGFYVKKYIVPAGLTPVVHDVVLISKRVTLQTLEVQALTPYEQDSVARIRTFGHYLGLPVVPLFGGSTSGIGITMHPITYFSKGERRKRRFHKMYKQFEKDAFIDSRYTRKLVHRLTGMTGDSLRIFMFKVRPDYEFTRHAADLLFWSWILHKYKAWRKNGSLAF